MSSEVLRMIAALVSWSAFSLSAIMTYQRAAEGDDLGDDVRFKFWFMLSVFSLTACIYCLSLTDMGDSVWMFASTWFFLVIFAWIYCSIAVTALFPLSSDTFFIVLTALFISTTLFWILCGSVGCIQLCEKDGRILACLPVFLMVLAHIVWGGSSAELHCGPHKWSPMIPQIASLYAPNGIKPNDLRPIVWVVCFLPWRPTSLLPTMDEDIPAGTWRNGGTTSLPKSLCCAPLLAQFWKLQLSLLTDCSGIQEQNWASHFSLKCRTELDPQDVCGMLCLSQCGTWSIRWDCTLPWTLWLCAVWSHWRRGQIGNCGSSSSRRFAPRTWPLVLPRTSCIATENTTIRRQCLPHVCCPCWATKFTFSRTMWLERCVSLSLIVCQGICALQAWSWVISALFRRLSPWPCCAPTQPQGVAYLRLTGRLLMLHLPCWLATSGAVQRRKGTTCLRGLALARDMALCGDSWWRSWERLVVFVRSWISPFQLPLGKSSWEHRAANFLIASYTWRSSSCSVEVRSFFSIVISGVKIVMIPLVRETVLPSFIRTFGCSAAKLDLYIKNTAGKHLFVRGDKIVSCIEQFGWIEVKQALIEAGTRRDAKSAQEALLAAASEGKGSQLKKTFAAWGQDTNFVLADAVYEDDMGKLQLLTTCGFDVTEKYTHPEVNGGSPVTLKDIVTAKHCNREERSLSALGEEILALLKGNESEQEEGDDAGCGGQLVRWVRKTFHFVRFWRTVLKVLCFQ